MEKISSKPKRRPSKRTKNTIKRDGAEKALKVRARLWLESGGETYLAPGRVTLLERIGVYGSISAAARSMEMSYRHAWLLVEDMNAKAKEPLVVRSSGGRGGGGTVLTEEGRSAITSFTALQDRLRAFMEEASLEEQA